jgi:shikimate kinase
MKVFLLGLPGSGKTTLGRLLSASLEIPFIDLDELIEKEAGKPVQAIFRDDGEPAFRTFESGLLRRHCALETDYVMATGGGTPCFSDNIIAINQAGTSIFLDIAPKVIAQRIIKTDLSSRPLFAKLHPENLKDAIEFMRSQRMSYYRQAHLTIGPDMSTDEVITLLRMENQR